MIQYAVVKGEVAVSATVGENAASLQVGRSVRAAPLDRIYGHEGKRRRYRRLINENYPQDTPSNTFGPAAPSGKIGESSRCKRGVPSSNTN